MSSSFVKPDKHKKTIIISAGGTGGHIFPALAVANQLKQQFNILWVGAKIGLENKLVPEYGYPLVCVSIAGVRNKGWRRSLLLPLTLVGAHLQCLWIILKYKPCVVVGFGGYATFPIGLTARLLGKRLIIHEQNSVIGLTNRILAKVASIVLCAFPNVFINNKSYVVGNPVREEIINLIKVSPVIKSVDQIAKLRILIVGGSLGAKALNDNVPLALIKQINKIASVTHQVGRGDVSLVQDAYKEHNINAKVVNFISDMADAYANTDLVICRAGASTVAEVACAGVAAIFVPYPYAVDDHQTGNAKYLVNNNAAFILPQATLTPQILADLLEDLTVEKCAAIGIKARELAILDSTSQISEQIINLCS